MCACIVVSAGSTLAVSHNFFDPAPENSWGTWVGRLRSETNKG